MGIRSRLAQLRRHLRTGRAGDPLDRAAIARRFLRGDGIEIGALHQPLPTPRGARVRYVDRLSGRELRAHYPELAGERLVEPDVLDDGERLARFADASLDFVIANHFLEHCQDPIGALRSFARTLRPGGVLFLAVPDKRHSFDRERPVTPLEHLWRDHREGPGWSRRAHYEEWVRVVHRVEDEAWALNRVEHLMASGYSIHFHVWTQRELLELLTSLTREPGFELELELFVAGEEHVAVLRKRAG